MRKQGGFTIIEVSLYLSISAMVAAALIAGVMSMVNKQQWNDNMHQMVTLVQTQFQEMNNNINTKSGAGTGKTLLLGRQITFSSGKYTTSDIVGNDVCNAAINTPANIVEDCKDDMIALQTAGLSVQNTSTVNIPWHNTISGIATLSNGTFSGTLDQTLMILRSPRSGTVYTFASPVAIGSGSVNLIAENTSELAVLVKNNVSGDGDGAVCIGASSSSSSVMRGTWDGANKTNCNTNLGN